MFKKKITPKTVKDLLEEWDPEVKERVCFQRISYNYRASENGFTRIQGIAALFEKEIVIYEEGRKISTYPLEKMDDAILVADGASARIVLRKNEHRFTVATGDLKHKERFGAYVQALNRYIEEGVYTPPAAINDQTCPKCGRPYRPGSRNCLYCGDKKRKMLWLLSMVKPLIPQLLLSLFIFLAISLVGLISPLLSEKMVDGYLKRSDASTSMIAPYLAVVSAMLLCTVSSRFLSALRSILSARIGCKAILTLRNSVFDKIMQLSLSRIHHRTVGELMQRVSSDTAVIKNFLVSDLGDILEKIFSIMAIGSILIYYDIQKHTCLFLLIFVPAVPCTFIYKAFRQKINRMYHTQWLVNSKADSILHDIFSGIRVVKAYGREKYEMEHYDGSIAAVKGIQKHNEIFWAVFSPMINFFLCMGEFFILFFVGNKILGGEMTLGEMTKLTAYASMIYVPLRTMAFIPRRIMRATTSLSKIFDVMEDENVLTGTIGAPDAEIQGQIVLEDVSFGYEAGKQVLKHINLQVHPGEMIGLVGRSGVGKSTLINLVMHLYTAEEGRVLIDGKDIKDLHPACLRRSIGAVLQETFLFAGSIRANISYAKPDATGEEIIAAAKMAGAHDFIMKMQDGYDTYVGEKGCTLSGGERQRIAIARAVLLNPKILILDEATSALDTETEKQIQETLKKLIEGRTTIAIAHRLSTLRNATRIVVLDNGGIAETGTHEELMRNSNGIYYGLVMAQRKMSSKKNTV